MIIEDDVECLKVENRQLTANLTSVQTRCSELLEEGRRLRWLLVDMIAAMNEPGFSDSHTDVVNWLYSQEPRMRALAMNKATP